VNAPLIDSSARTANVLALRAALEACANDGLTGPVREVKSKCRKDYTDGFRSAESCLAIAAAYIVCGPAPQNRRYGNSYRLGLSTMPDYSDMLAAKYCDLAIEAMTAIQSVIAGHTPFDDELHKHYQQAIDGEEARLDVLLESSAVTAI